MTAIYLIAGVAVIVWAGIFVLRGSLIAGCLTFLVVAACFGHEFFNFDLGPVPLTLDRLVLVLLVVAYAVQRRLGRTDPKPLAWTDVLLMVFLGVLALSGFWGGWSGHRTGLVGHFHPLYRFTAGYLIPFAIYWIARQAPLDRSNVTRTQAALVCLGVYLAATGLLEVAGQWWAVFPRHIADPDAGIHYGRARGPMVHSVRFGLCLSVCLLAAWVWRRRLGRPGQLVIFALMPLMLAGLYFSYTRSVWMGAGLGLMVVLGLTLGPRWRALALGGMASAALLVGVTRMDQLVRFQREHSAVNTGKSVELRKSFAYISWKMFRDRPLWGVGFGQFPQAKLPYLADRSTGLHLEATRPMAHHSTLLSLLTETGLIGLAVYLGVVVGWGRAAWALCRDPKAPDWARAQGALLLGALAICLCQMAFHELSYAPIENALVFFLAGTTVGLRRRAEPEPALW